MPTYRSTSYRPSECCNADCYNGSEKEPCWGTVTLVGEDSFGDDSCWVHRCEGHEVDGKYTPETQNPAT